MLLAKNYREENQIRKEETHLLINDLLIIIKKCNKRQT